MTAPDAKQGVWQKSQIDNLKRKEIKVETIRELEKMLSSLSKDSPRKAAEVAYVLARIHLRKKDFEKAMQFGRTSILLFDRCKMETEEDCAVRFLSLGGVCLPDIIHQEVVRRNLQPLIL